MTCVVSDPCGATVTDGARRFTLNNGLTVILKEDQSAPVVAIQVWVKTGSANEDEKEAGIAHFIEHMMFKGTPSRKTGEIARTIESSGGRINAYTSLDQTVYYVEIAGSHFDRGLDVLLDAVQHPLFDPGEIEKEKEVVLEEYRRSLDIPQRRLGKTMMRLCFKEHPYGRPIIGYEQTIRSFDRKAILKYMDKWYTPDNMVLVAVGDFDTALALNMINSLVRDFPKKAGKRPCRPVEPEQISLRKTVLNEDVQQIYLDMSWHTPSLTDRHLPALELLEIILAHGKSSRFYTRLKMQKNLVYSINAGIWAPLDPGLFGIDATLNPDQLESALEAISGEIVRITNISVPGPELSKAKIMAEADFVYNMETMVGQARTLAFFQTMTGDMYDADDYLKRLKQITPDDIGNVAKAYLRPQNLSIGILAPKGADIRLTRQETMELFSGSGKHPTYRTAESAKEDGDVSMVVLSNGMRVIIKENHNLPVVSFTGAFLGGSRLEWPEQCGISNFTATMLTRGTKERSAAEIASAVESSAGALHGFSGRNSFGLRAKFLSKDLYPGIELVSDIVLGPTFPESEIDKVREDILTAIKAKKDRPTAQLFDLFYETLFRHHSYGYPETGTEKSIQTIKRSNLIKWYTSLAIPSNFVLAVVGDLDREQLISYIKVLFADFNPSQEKLPEVPPEPPLTKSCQVHLKRTGAQTHLAIGYLGADLKSPYNASMALINTALSGQGGRLFYHLRDKKSLAYTVTSFRRPGLETGVFGLYLACEPKKLLIAKEAAFRELEVLRQKGLTQDELNEAKRYFLGNLKIGLETNGSQAMHMALDELYGLGYDNIRRFIKDIEVVSLKDIKRAVKEIIIPERFVLVTVGPEPGNP